MNDACWDPTPDDPREKRKSERFALQYSVPQVVRLVRISYRIIDMLSPSEQFAFALNHQ